MPSDETLINRANTEAFINADPVSIVLVPVNKNDDGEGGFKMEPGAPLEAQTLRLIPQSDVMPSVTTPDGIQLLPTYVLLGMHDATLPRWSLFSLGGVDFIITSPTRPDFRTIDNAYEAKVDVARV